VFDNNQLQIFAKMMIDGRLHCKVVWISQDVYYYNFEKKKQGFESEFIAIVMMIC